MQRNYTRRERRELAKQFGMLPKNESRKAWYSRLTRGIQAGKQIHLNYVTEVENSMRNAATDREADQIKRLSETMGEEAAREFVGRNRTIKHEREEEIYQRRKRQKAKYEEKINKRS